MAPRARLSLSVMVATPLGVLAAGSFPVDSSFSGKVDAGTVFTYHFTETSTGEDPAICGEIEPQDREITCRVSLPNHGAHVIKCGKDYAGWSIDSCYAFKDQGLGRHKRTGNACSNFIEWMARPTTEVPEAIHNMDFSRTVTTQKATILGEERLLHCHQYEEGEMLSTTCFNYQVGLVSYSTGDMCAETEVILTGVASSE